MRTRKTIFVLTLILLLSVILRRSGIGYASMLINVATYAIAICVLLSKDLFRTLLAKVVLASSLIASLGILQYWLESDFIIIPSFFALLIFMLLSFKYIIHKPTGLLLFVYVFFIFLLSVTLNPRQFHNLFRSTTFEDYILSKYRQDQGHLADYVINKYKVIDREKSSELLVKAVKEDSLKNTEAALELYSKSIACNPDNAVAYHGRGFLKLTRLELNLSNATSSLKDFSRAIRLNPEYADAYFQRSMTYAYLGDKGRAFIDRLKVLQLDSLMPDPQFEAKYGCSKKSLSIPPDS